jgi:hypothetical protein
VKPPALWPLWFYASLPYLCLYIHTRDMEEPLASQADTDTAAGIVFLSVPGIGLLLVAELLAWWGSLEPRVNLQRGLRVALFAVFAWRLFEAATHFNG